ncbi:MAG: type II toxin-antitoxin system VapC family toxin [Saprospiraceae bacterium]
MGISDLQQKLSGFSRIALDTAPIIYFVEANRTYKSLTDIVFQSISNKSLQGFTSMISLTEVLVHPIEKQFTVLQQQYMRLLLNSAHFSTKMLDMAVAIKAAELRANYKQHAIRTPDAIQIAVALLQNCDAFISNDQKLKVIQEIEVIILEDYI